jgi:hypothetical protein
MGSPSRAYKLRLSPAGIDLLIDCHCRIIRTARALLPYGTTLHAALHCLDGVSDAELLEDLDDLPGYALAGRETLFVGAPRQMAELASQIADRVAEAAPNDPAPALSQIYLVSLRRLMVAQVNDMLRALENCGRMKSE